MGNITLTPLKGYEENADRFINDYDIVDALLPFDSNWGKLKPKHERSCRFCGRKFGETKFTKEAHLIPDLLGNKLIFSDFECDDCNHFFGITYENELANYLGIYRTIVGVKGKAGIPGFTAPGKTIKAKGGLILGEETIVISREDFTNKAISFDVAKGEINIKFTKNPFSPIGVYKSMLKVALSLISEDEVMNDYKLALKFLMDKNNSKLKGCLISGFELPLNFNFPPHAFLFKKRNAVTKTHTHVMALYFQNMIISLPVPLNRHDLYFYENEESLIINLYPPLFTQYTNRKGLIVKAFHDDFSEQEKQKGIEDEITIQVPAEELAKTVAFDSKTGEYHKTEFNPSEIAQIIIRRGNNDWVNPSELMQSLNKFGKK